MIRSIEQVIFCMTAMFLMGTLHVSGQNALTPVSLKTFASLDHIAVHYDISGDENLNSNMSISYRAAGSSMALEQGARTMRAHPDLVVDGSALNRNFHAGSILFLQPGEDYQVVVTLTDPDGGSTSDTVVVTTQHIPVPATNGAMNYVIPGSGGGSGTMADPYLGLQEAADQALPGDIFNVGPGIYAPFSLNVSGNSGDPIVFRSEALHQAIIDGNNTNIGVITLGVYNDSLQHIIIDGFQIQNGRWGIDAQNTQYLTVRNNKLLDVDYGIVNRRGNGWEHHQYIMNNSFEGRTPWPQTMGEIPSERGIDIRGNVNVVSFNYVSHFGDGISTDGPPYGRNYCLDVHHNDIFEVVDDMIEVDGGISNLCVYQNRGFNGRMGVSLAPVFGGPCYVFRNVFYNMETSAYKLNRSPSGLIVCHNTAIKSGNGMSSPSGWQNTYFRNNILMGTRYCFEEYGVVAGSVDDWDFDAYFSTRSGTQGNEWFKWDNVRYDDVPDLASSSGIEAAAYSTDLADLMNVSMPGNFAVSYSPTNFDFSLPSASSLIDQGDDLTHLNHPYVSDGFPDIGALEFGHATPEYGPDFDGLSNIKISLSPGDIQVYPNPSNNYIFIEGSLIDYQIDILDINGVIVDQIDTVDTQYYLDISNLGTGLFFLRVIHHTNGVVCFKTIVKL